MKKITFKLWVVALAFTGFSAMAQTNYLIDFNFNTDAANVSAGNWNNLANATNGSVANIVSDAGVASTYSVAVTDDFVSANQLGSDTPNSALGFPSTATRDAFYGQDGANATGGFTISGLNAAKVYTFVIFGARTGQTDNREAKYTAAGGNSVIGYLNASSNNDNVATLVNVQPTPAGVITLTCEKGPNNTNGSHYFYINCMKMTETTPAAPAQVLLDCEDGTTNKLATMNVFANGAAGSSADLVVVDNPAPSTVNPSTKCVKFTRRTTGADPWAGFWCPVTDPDPDFTGNKYVHVKILKPTTTPQRFKIEGGPNGTFEIASSNSYTTANVWQDIVFDYSLMTPAGGAYPIVAFIPDFDDPLTPGADRIIYFDDIVVNSDPTGVIVVPPPASQDLVLLDCEDGTTNKLATMNVFANGPGQANTDMVVIPNPNPSGINTSTKCIQFTRRTTGADAQSWAGFWCPVTDPDPNFTTDKFVHVKVMKANTSPVKFKIEGGPSGTTEVESVNAYTTPGQWQDMVFDYTTKTGVYPIVALMPDFEDPLVAGADRIIYFDDIRVNNIATPLSLQDNTLNSKVAIYPNPTSTILNIDTFEALQSATIYSIDGRIVAQLGKIEMGTSTINTSNLISGMYLIEFTAENGVKATKKFIKN